MNKTNPKSNQECNESSADIAVDENVSGNYDENCCVVCFKNVEIFSIGDCDHPVCYNCSTRMRVVCEQNECPICRHMLTKVIFTTEKLPYRELEAKNRSKLYSKRYSICFANSQIQQKFYELLDHPCPICDKRSFRTLKGLRVHVRKQHNRVYCDLCVDNLKIFTTERRCYTLDELKVHEVKGDADNRSHRGHPLCEYCRMRFLDRDEIFRHLRREHYYCHFCEANGRNEFYKDYKELADHFRKEHFLCEEGACAEQEFVGAFRSEIDYKAHIANFHGQSFSKRQAKQARVVQLQLTLGPRGSNEQMEEGRLMQADDDRQYNQPAANANPEASFTDQEFPALAGASGSSMPFTTANPIQIRNFSNASGLVRSNENFPALGSGSTNNTISNNSKNSNAKPMSELLRKPNEVVTGAIPRTTAYSNGVYSQKTMQPLTIQKASVAAAKSKPVSAIDFPALPSSGKSTKATANQNLSQKKSAAKALPNEKVLISEKSSSSANSRPSEPFATTPQSKSMNVMDFPALPAKSKITNTHQYPDHQSNSLSKVLQNEKPVAISNFSTAIEAKAPKNLGSQIKSTNANDFPDLPPTIKSSVTFKVPVKATTKAINKAINNEFTVQTSNPTSKKSSKTLESLNVLNSTIKAKKMVTRKKLEEDMPPSFFNELHIGNVSAKHRPLIDDYISVASATNLQKLQLVQKEKKSAKNSTSDKNAPKLDVSNFPQLTENPVADASNAKVWVKMSELKKRELENPMPKVAPVYDLTSNKVANTQEQQAKNDQKSKTSSLPDNHKYIDVKTQTGQSCSPPGFNSNQKSVPPGFSAKVSNTNGHKYIHPLHSTVRNQRLAENLKEALADPAVLAEFRRFSQLFREGNCKPEAFYECCRSALKDLFTGIFSELLALLPDINKQQDLLAAHKAYVDNLTDDKAKSEPLFKVCDMCTQVLIPSDVECHKAMHEVKIQFPSL